MDIFLMYVLMIIDLTWTLMHHEEAGEMNPLFERLLMDNEVVFVYIKLAANSIAAFIVIYLRPKYKIMSHALAIFGIIVYGIVVYLHWFVYMSIKHAHDVEGTVLWNMMYNNAGN